MPYVDVINKFDFNSNFLRMHIKVFNFSNYDNALSQTRRKLATFFGLHIQGKIVKFTIFGNFALFLKMKLSRKRQFFSFLSEIEAKWS